MIGPSGDWPDEMDDVAPGRTCGVSETVVTVQVMTVSGRVVSIELRLGGEAVEVWFRQRRCAVIDRGVMQCWVDDPHVPLVVDEVALSLRGRPGSAQIALSVPDVIVWTMEAPELARLRAQL